MCLGYSKEPSHRDVSFEYPQHMFWLKKKSITHSYLEAWLPIVGPNNMV